MKVNDETIESLWHGIISLLKGAHHAGTWAFWRERFNCTHPQHDPSEIDNPARYAEACFHAAKVVYCKRKDELDKFMQDIKNGIISPYLATGEDFELFNAMKCVVEEEMASQLEEQILNGEEEVRGYWEGDEFLPLPNPNVELELDSY